ncbi:YesK family protein [Paenibacillus pinihumi]|uniref:YesK family protein n=1 Tax=Paenibacillus pinihumi TaxID=669462 RepID=UPI0004212B7E|nr:YesK family protein [Paenibacillus pinihumi]
MDFIFLIAVAGCAALILLIIAHFMYQRSPDKPVLLFLPSGVALLLCAVTFIISMNTGGFRGLGYGILSAAAGAGSIIGVIGIALLAYIGNQKRRKDAP